MTKNDESHAIAATDSLIVTVRNQKVILDADLARIYGVPTKRLNEQVRGAPTGSRPTSRFNLRRKRLQT